MTNKLKRNAVYLVIVVALGSIGFYASMEEYQKENFAKLISQTFS